MPGPVHATPLPSSTPELQRRFQTLLPRIETHAGIYFRFVTCPQKKADCVAETVALAWKWFIALARRGKDANNFGVAFVSYAVKAVHSGRRVCGMIQAKDVLNEQAQRRFGFVVGKLPETATPTSNPLVDALHDNTKTPPPDAAAFRIDWPSWLRTRTNRDRRIINKMMLSESTLALGRTFGLSPSRISQLRGEYHADWQRYHGETLVNDASTVKSV